MGTGWGGNFCPSCLVSIWLEASYLNGLQRTPSSQWPHLPSISQSADEALGVLRPPNASPQDILQRTWHALTKHWGQAPPFLAAGLLLHVPWPMDFSKETLRSGRCCALSAIFTWRTPTLPTQENKRAKNTMDT